MDLLGTYWDNRLGDGWQLDLNKGVDLSEDIQVGKHIPAIRMRARMGEESQFLDVCLQANQKEEKIHIKSDYLSFRGSFTSQNATMANTIVWKSPAINWVNLVSYFFHTLVKRKLSRRVIKDKIAYFMALCI